MIEAPRAVPSLLASLDGAGASETYRRTALMGFLRARREEVEPDPSWPVVDPLTPRRVRGLRREELAWAADMSVDYYTKLEQGRASHPSSAVVDGLSEALSLSAVDRRYFGALAMANPVVATPDHPQERRAVRKALVDLAALISDPVMIHLLDSDLTMTSLNASTVDVLYPHGSPHGLEDRALSLLSYVFDEPQSRRVYVDWVDKAREVVGLAHMTLATTIPTRALLESLAASWEHSPALRHLWFRYEPRDKGQGTWRIRFADGEVAPCRYATVQTPSSQDLSLVVYSRLDDSESSSGRRP